MRRNVGLVDRILRVFIGLIMAGLAIYFKNLFGIIAFYPILTAVFGWDPFYVMLGIDTDL